MLTARSVTSLNIQVLRNQLFAKETTVLESFGIFLHAVCHRGCRVEQNFLIFAKFKYIDFPWNNERNNVAIRRPLIIGRKCQLIGTYP